MTFQPRYLLAVAAVLAALAGCDTIKRARTAQKAVAAATNDVPAAVSKPLPRVNLLGAKFIDFVEFAMTNRPSLEAARLAVSNAVISVIEATSDRELKVNLWRLLAVYGQRRKPLLLAPESWEGDGRHLLRPAAGGLRPHRRA